MMRFNLLFLTLLLLLAQAAAASGIRGRITTKNNEPLPYAGITVKNSPLGTISNADGFYELPLPEGPYEIEFQFLGFQTVIRKIGIQQDFQTINITMEEQAINLQSAHVGKTSEDPAYTVMRRAIAKARFHEMQLKSYTAMAYTRTTGTLTKIPFLARRRFKKEGIEENKVFLNESATEIKYTRPDKYEQKVLSTRNSLDNSIPTPNQYVLASFYSPDIQGTVSPLSPKAFSFYRFEYEGFFEDRGMVVNKIKVIPKAYGEGVVKGTIYILEDLWAIHSFDLQTTAQGFSIGLKQTSAPVQSVWVPMSQHFNLQGQFLGFAGNMKYIVSLQYKQISIDPALKEDIRILDHKKEETATVRNKKNPDLETMIAEQKEFSTRDFRKMVKEFEKEQTRERKEKGEDIRVVRNDSIVIDSLAHKRDTTYWATLRPIPLTQNEIRSYKSLDSLQIRKDSTRAARNNASDTLSFKPFHILTGATYRFKNLNRLIYQGPLQTIAYNTVEGFVADASLQWHKRWAGNYTAGIKPLARYAIGRKQLSGTLTGHISNKDWTLKMEGGQYVYQLNRNNPVNPVINSIASLLFERNLIRIYQKKFARIDYQYRYLGDIVTLSGSLEWASRNEMFNLDKARPLINRKDVDYVPNRPVNQESIETVIGHSRALVFGLTARIRPWQKYTVRNGQKRASYNHGPELTLHYEKGIPAGNHKTADFNFLQADVYQHFELGPRSSLKVAASGGGFAGSKNLNFIDYKHFMGNEFFFQTGNPLTTFRMLPYYQYSTGKHFFQSHALWTSQRLLFTQFPLIRMTGISETIQHHYLNTPSSGHYNEWVYGLDGIFRIFRIELTAQFHRLHYQQLGFRIGTIINIR